MGNLLQSSARRRARQCGGQAQKVPHPHRQFLERNWRLGDLPALLGSGTQHRAGCGIAPDQQAGETGGPMVAPTAGIEPGGPPELSRAHDQRGCEQSAIREIIDKGRQGRVKLRPDPTLIVEHRGRGGLRTAVGVPRPFPFQPLERVDGHEPDPLLHELPRLQELAAHRRVTIPLARGGGLAGEIGHHRLRLLLVVDDSGHVPLRGDDTGTVRSTARRGCVSAARVRSRPMQSAAQEHIRRHVPRIGQLRRHADAQTRRGLTTPSEPARLQELQTRLVNRCRGMVQRAHHRQPIGSGRELRQRLREGDAGDGSGDRPQRPADIPRGGRLGVESLPGARPAVQQNEHHRGGLMRSATAPSARRSATGSPIRLIPPTARKSRRETPSRLRARLAIPVILKRTLRTHTRSLQPRRVDPRP